MKWLAFFVAWCIGLVVSLSGCSRVPLSSLLRAGGTLACHVCALAKVDHAGADAVGTVAAPCVHVAVIPADTPDAGGAPASAPGGAPAAGPLTTAPTDAGARAPDTP